LKLLEYEAKEVFRRYGIPTAQGAVVTDAGAAREFAESLGKPVVVKAQVAVGGRGKAGGIKAAETPAEAYDAAKAMLGMTIKGLEVGKVLVEQKIDIRHEVYVGVTVDRDSRCYVVLASSAGGMEIEEVAAEAPEKIIKHEVDPIDGFKTYHALGVAKSLGYTGRKLTQLAGIILKLVEVARGMDAELTEINPLAELEDGFVAADARLNVDNNALFRHVELEAKFLDSLQGELTPREMEARAQDLTYVELDGDIGVIGNGAGLTMATLDTVMLNGGKAGNFLDLGGGASPERIEKAVEFVLSDERIRALFVNVLGGITRCDDTAKGIVAARGRIGAKKPVVVRMMGTNEEEGRRILKEAGIDALDTMEEAATQAVRLAGGK